MQYIATITFYSGQTYELHIQGSDADMAKRRVRNYLENHSLPQAKKIKLKELVVGGEG